MSRVKARINRPYQRRTMGFKENLKRLISFMVRQAHHRRNQQTHHGRNREAHHERNQQAQDDHLNQQATVRPEPVEGLNQRFPNALIVLMSLLIGSVGVAYADDALTAKELLGRKIYREGSDGSQNEITTTFGLTENSVSATAFACANCHGLEGEGKQEGGLNVPAISSQHLFTNTPSNSPSKDKFYNENTLVLAITKGISVQNKPLSAAMPRYGLTAAQTQALLAYLKRLGSAGDVDAGVTVSEVQLGTVLPLTGPQAAIGKLLKATLDACIAVVNSQGSIYGRKVTLTALDSGSRKAEILASTKQLLSETQPFALISGYFPEVTTAIYELLAQERLPVIAPLSFAPKEISTPSPSFFYFLPSYADQSRALVDYWLVHLPNSKHPARPKSAIVYSDKAIGLNVAVAIREQLRSHHLDVVAEIGMSQATQEPTAKQITKLAKAKPDAVFFLGNASELKEFNKLVVKTDHQPILLGLLAMLGADVMNSPDLAIAKMLLATPFAPSDPGLQQFGTMLTQHSVSLQSPGLQRIACAGVNFVAEGLKRTGKHLSRAKFLHSLEEIKDFPVEIMPPLQFKPNNRQGVRGAYILTMDTKAGIVLPPSAWVTPSDNQH
jgi:ABC-type branched-subunit amino acid transport system substrate-binding protein